MLSNTEEGVFFDIAIFTGFEFFPPLVSIPLAFADELWVPLVWKPFVVVR